jgi:hypothetical protein
MEVKQRAKAPYPLDGTQGRLHTVACGQSLSRVGAFGEKAIHVLVYRDHLCGLVVRVPGYTPRGLGLIPGASRLSERQCVWTLPTHPREYN